MMLKPEYIVYLCIYTKHQLYLLEQHNESLKNLVSNYKD